MTSGDGLSPSAAKAYRSGKSLLDRTCHEGNYLEAGKDAYGIGSLAKDVDSFASGHSGELMGDPLEALIEAGLGFLIDLVAPLKDALNLVTGDPDGLNDKAEEWAGVAEEAARARPGGRRERRRRRTATGPAPPPTRSAPRSATSSAACRAWPARPTTSPTCCASARR